MATLGSKMTGCAVMKQTAIVKHHGERETKQKED